MSNLRTKYAVETISELRALDIFVRPIVTEKTMQTAEQGKVWFEVVNDATKMEIKAAAKLLFNVDVQAVNTQVLKGKTKRFRGKVGLRSDRKRAILTLAEGQSIDVSAGVSAKKGKR